MNKIKLKPCPFCGYSQATVRMCEHVPFARSAEVCCQVCGATVGGMGEMIGVRKNSEIKQWAITAWNTRKWPRQIKSGGKR